MIMKNETKLDQSNVKAATDIYNEINNDKIAYLQLKIPPSEKAAVKAFFATQGVSMTDGLMKCFYFVKNEIEKGNVKITRGGIFKK